jgi:hypothetical protein
MDPDTFKTFLETATRRALNSSRETL